MTMQVNPEISIVMPTYNHAQYVGTAIGSALAQTFQNFELIIIDNYSDDGTEDIVRSFDDVRIRYEKFRNDGIIGASRNRGMALARGDLIAFLDSDDRWHESKLAVVMTAFEYTPEIVAACHAENKLCNDQIVRVLENPAYVGDLYEKLLFHSNCLSTSATVVRSRIARALGGFSERSEFVGVEDYDFWIRIAKTGPIALLPEVLGDYRVHGNNFTNNRERLARRILTMLDTHYAAIPETLRNAKRRQISRRRARVMAACGVRLVQQGKLRGLPWLVRAVGEVLR